jgi:hypothetical protein
VTVLTALRGKQDRVIRVLDHPQGVASMAGLPSTPFAALFSQARRFADGLFEPVAGRELTPVVAVFGGLSFQLLDASVGLFKLFQGSCQLVVQGPIFGCLVFQLLDASAGLLKTFQGLCQLVAQALIFGSLRLQLFHQFECVHEDTLPDFFLVLNPFGAFVLKEARKLSSYASSLVAPSSIGKMCRIVQSFS